MRQLRTHNTSRASISKTVTLKSRLRVTQGHLNAWVHAVSYSPSIVTNTMAILVSFVRYSDFLVENWKIIPHLYLAP